MDFMFSDCTSLESLDVRNFDTSKVTDMSYMFYGCKNLNTVYAGKGWTTAANASGMFDGCPAKGVSIAYLDEETGVLNIGGYVNQAQVRQFVHNENVKAVIAAEGTVLPEDSSMLFADILAESIDLTNADTSGVKDMSDLFNGPT